MKQEVWTFYQEVEKEDLGNGIVRRVLAYGEELMLVENRFEEGAVGTLHHHPHTQVTYVVSGLFSFEIDGVTKLVKAGDSMFKKGGVLHGCKCLEAGVLLDIFHPMREDFL